MAFSALRRYLQSRHAKSGGLLSLARQEEATIKMLPRADKLELIATQAA